jgi:rubredoxin
MKFQCDACERLAPLEVFRVEAGALVVTCGRCGAESRAQASLSTSVAMGGAASPREGTAAPGVPPQDAAAVPPLPARASSPALRVVRGADTPARPSTHDEELFEPPPGFCPKCVAARREGAMACAQCGLVYDNYRADEQRPSQAVAEAWRELAARWEDPTAHERMVTLALSHGDLAAVGRLYRIRLARAPEDALARRGRDEVVNRAAMVVPLASERSGPGASLKRMKGVVAGVMFLVMLVLAVLVFSQLRTMMDGP